MPKIKSVDLTAFRGIVGEHILLDGKSLFLHGENGTGKSSVIDGLQYFFSGEIDALSGAQALSTRRHAPNITCDESRLAVRIMFAGFEAHMERTIGREPEVPASIDAFIRQAAGTRFILRRQQLLAFIVEQAAPRYQQLAKLIGIEDLDTLERAWKVASDSAKEAAAQTTREVREARSTLTTRLQLADDFSDEAILSALNVQLASLAMPHVTDFAAADQAKIQAVQTSGQGSRAITIARFERARTLASRIYQQVNRLTEHEQLWNAIDKAKIEAKKIRELRYRQVLVQARKLVADFKPELCPVCEQPIDLGVITERLDERILLSGELVRHLEEIDGLCQSLLRDVATLQSEARQLRADISQETDGASQEAGFVHQWVSYQEILSQVDKWCDEQRTLFTQQVHELRPGSFTAFIDSAVLRTIAEVCTSLHADLERRIADLDATEQDRRTVSVIDLLTHVTQSQRTLRSAETRLVLTQRRATRLKKIYEKLVATKREQVQELYDSLQADIGRYYNMLHPDEPHGEVRIEVVAGRRGSAEIQIPFGGATADPRAYNSEGHLDSLGLCIFLAFVKHFNTGVPFLALDDVVSSIDARHRGRICQLIFQEFPNHQLFITTHDDLWFEQLLASARAYRFSQFSALRIVDWTLESGPRFDKHRTRWEDISKKIEDRDKQGAAGKIRHSLEWMLTELVVNLEGRVLLRRDGRYDVGALLPVVRERARKLIPDFERTNEAVLARFAANQILGNLITHYNPSMETVSIEEIADFADATKAFQDLFMCSICGEFIKYYRDASIVKCACTAGGKSWPIA